MAETRRARYMAVEAKDDRQMFELAMSALRKNIEIRKTVIVVASSPREISMVLIPRFWRLGKPVKIEAVQLNVGVKAVKELLA